MVCNMVRNCKSRGASNIIRIYSSLHEDYGLISEQLSFTRKVDYERRQRFKMVGAQPQSCLEVLTGDNVDDE